MDEHIINGFKKAEFKFEISDKVLKTTKTSTTSDPVRGGWAGGLFQMSIAVSKKAVCTFISCYGKIKH